MHRSTERMLVIGLLLVTTAYAVAEDVTLTSYYPAPRGVYNALQTTGSTFLAEQPLAGGNNVGVGTAAPGAGFKLDVSGTVQGVDLVCADQVNGCISDTEIGAGAVGPSEIQANAVTTAKIANGAVSSTGSRSNGSDKIPAGAIPSTGLATNGSDKIVTNAVDARALRKTSVTAGTYPSPNDGNWIPRIRVDRDGRIRGATSVAVGTGASSSDLTGSLLAGSGILLSPDPWDPSSGNATIELNGGAAPAQVRLDCLVVETGASLADCPAGYTVTGCGTFGSGEDDQISNNGAGNGCFNNENHVWARCCRLVPN